MNHCVWYCDLSGLPDKIYYNIIIWKVTQLSSTWLSSFDWICATKNNLKKKQKLKTNSMETIWHYFVFYYIILIKDETQKSLVELKPCEWLYSPAYYPWGLWAVVKMWIYSETDKNSKCEVKFKSYTKDEPCYTIVHIIIKLHLLTKSIWYHSYAALILMKKCLNLFVLDTVLKHSN